MRYYWRAICRCSKWSCNVCRYCRWYYNFYRHSSWLQDKIQTILSRVYMHLHCVQYQAHNPSTHIHSLFFVQHIHVPFLVSFLNNRWQPISKSCSSITISGLLILGLAFFAYAKVAPRSIECAASDVKTVLRYL